MVEEFEGARDLPGLGFAAAEVPLVEHHDGILIGVVENAAVGFVFVEHLLDVLRQECAIGRAIGDPAMGVDDRVG